MSPPSSKKLLRWLVIAVIALNLVIIVKVLLPKPLVYKGKTVEQWAIDLNGDQRTRDNATAIFQELGPGAVPDLMKLLQGEDSWFRKRIFAVARKSPTPIRRLIYRFVKPVYWPDVHITAARALGIIGPDAKDSVPLLDDKLRNSDGTLAMGAAQALGAIGRDSVASLIADLTNRNAEVRHRAVYALSEMGTNAIPAIPSLTERFADDYEHVRNAAAAAVVGIGRPGRDAVLRAITERTGIARCAAIQAIKGAPGGDEFVPALLIAVKDSDSTTRLVATATLGAINPWKKEVVKVMIESLNDSDGTVRREAIINLGKAPWKAHAAIPQLTELQNDADESVRIAARETLDKIKSAQVLPTSPK